MEDAKKYQRLVENLGNEYFFYSHNLDGKYLYISPSVEKVLGYTVEEAFDGLVKHITDSELNKKTLETLKKSASGEKQKTFELELYTKKRSVKVMEITESPVYDSNGKLFTIEGIAHDITKRKKQQELIKKQNKELKQQDDELRKNLDELIATNKVNEALKKEVSASQKLLLKIINEIPEKIFLKDEKGKFLLANKRVAANYGIKPKELVGKSDFDFYTPEVAQTLFERDEAIKANGKAHSFEEGKVDEEDGLIVRTTLQPFQIKHLNQTGLLGIQIDITEIRKAQQQQKELNEQLNIRQQELEATIKNLKETQSQLVHSEKLGALGHLIAGIAHEINTPIGAINASVGNITASIDASMQNLFDLFTRLSKKDLIAFLRIMNLIDISKPALTSKERRQYKKNIRKRIEESKLGNAYSITDLIIYLSLHDDVEQLIKYLDVSKPEYILQSIKDIYSVRKNSENIKLAVDKASKVVFALKKFAHKDQGGEMEKANIIDSIETVLTLHHNRIKQGIEVIRNFDEIPLVSCYPDELIQVWSNLVNNSIHAMENKGTLTIGVRNIGEKVQVSISDTGCGIPEEIREKIFEPFFTTKKAGEGTGIGLDLIVKILDKHQATIDLETKVGIGTTFTITLPVK